MSEAGAAIQRFDFDQGALRGSSMTLYASCLVHRSDFQLELAECSSDFLERGGVARIELRIGKL